MNSQVHTDDAIAYVLYDTGIRDGPVGVFTGDARFCRDLGAPIFSRPQREK